MIAVKASVKAAVINGAQRIPAHSVVARYIYGSFSPDEHYVRVGGHSPGTGRNWNMSLCLIVRECTRRAFKTKPRLVSILNDYRQCIDSVRPVSP